MTLTALDRATTSYATTRSPVGELLLTAGPAGLTGVYLEPPPLAAGRRLDEDGLSAAAGQLAEYFAGERTSFDLELAPSGTPFQLRVWQELRRVPYGSTVTYGELARRLGLPRAARAVGAANGQNPLSIVVPCHRVVGSGGSLVGYSGGLGRKRALLELEARRGA